MYKHCKCKEKCRTEQENAQNFKYTLSTFQRNTLTFTQLD